VTKPHRSQRTQGQEQTSATLLPTRRRTPENDLSSGAPLSVRASAYLPSNSIRNSGMATANSRDLLSRGRADIQCARRVNRPHPDRDLAALKLSVSERMPLGAMSEVCPNDGLTRSTSRTCYRNLTSIGVTPTSCVKKFAISTTFIAVRHVRTDSSH
jgi:hypothetical protein